MLDRVAFVPAEGQVLVDGGVTDTLLRLQRGDPVAGWEGDPNMELMCDLETGMFDVWTLDVQGEPTLVLDSRPYCDQRLIADVVRADSRRFDVAGRIRAKNEQRERDIARNESDRRAELADKLHFALLKDTGHLVGGLTRRVF